MTCGVAAARATAAAVPSLLSPHAAPVLPASVAGVEAPQLLPPRL
eukprot:CAMPEP_0115710182 /NCGR_PEP_ID=MMETSP0272-20121206/72880_1 /TAXON_ID=71861 /ORGANISM="Scrippsiella trochoidea, Strain CCMP3099" /LENGTH=44 /DNA_ID= /DNA_START= /DNA_END= /DNA_ORIENTATION=